MLPSHLIAVLIFSTIITYLRLFSHPADCTANKKKTNPAVIPYHFKPLNALLIHVIHTLHTTGIPRPLSLPSAAHAFPPSLHCTISSHCTIKVYDKKRDRTITALPLYYSSILFFFTPPSTYQTHSYQPQQPQSQSRPDQPDQ